MKTLYLQCAMGAAGDMLTAALLELSENRQRFLETLNSLGLPGVRVTAEGTVKCGIRGTQMHVTIGGTQEDGAHSAGAAHSTAGDAANAGGDAGSAAQHRHSRLSDINALISALPVSEKVKSDISAVYSLLADAESRVHGVPVSLIHFHEVGALDALADIAGVCLLMEELAPDRVLCSPVHVGRGTVRCAHGILPVPAPATAQLLLGIPTYGGEIEGELCTPTGAALLKHFVTGFDAMPVMKVSRIGYGMGKKDFGTANCIRALLGEAEDASERIIELRCNLDDMTPEAIGFACERLFAAGAADVYTIAAGMKKNRPGTLLTCMCRESDRERLLALMFKHTTTLGIREYDCRRYTLKRTERVEQTERGSIRIKRSEGWGVVREKAEYEDLARIAREHDEAII